MDQYWSRGWPVLGVVDKQRHESGPVAYAAWQAAANVSESLTPYFGCHVEAALVSHAHMAKVGYELGLVFDPTDHLIVRCYAGGYLWDIYHYGLDFGSAHAQAGYSLGLQIGARW